MSLIEKPGNNSPSHYVGPITVVRPPVALIIAQAVLLVVVIGAFFAESFTVDIVIALVGVFGSVLLFGVTRMIDDRQRSKPSYADWSFAPARKAALGIMLATWVAGMVHVYFVAVEMTRGLG